MSIVNKRIKQFESELESIEKRIKLIEDEVKLQGKKMVVCAKNQLVMEKRSDQAPQVRPHSVSEQQAVEEPLKTDPVKNTNFRL